MRTAFELVVFVQCIYDWTPVRFQTSFTPGFLKRQDAFFSPANKIKSWTNNFCRTMLCISAAYAVMQCLSVTFVDCVKTNKRIFNFFSPPGSQAILVFQLQTAWQYSDGTPPPTNKGVECRWGRQKSQFWAYILLTACCWHCNRQVLSTRSPVDHGHRCASCDTLLVVSISVDCGRRRQNVYDKKSQRYTEDNTTAYLTARSDKSVAYVTTSIKTLLDVLYCWS